MGGSRESFLFLADLYIGVLTTGIFLRNFFWVYYRLTHPSCWMEVFCTVVDAALERLLQNFRVLGESFVIRVFVNHLLDLLHLKVVLLLGQGKLP